MRTTETNEVKILYNGLPNNGNNTGVNTEIGKSTYNDKDNHNAYVGYMYGEESISSSIIHTGKSEHYSGFAFKNSKMIAGNENMPTHDGTSTTIGNSGNGYVKITFLWIF